jgi:hypothetical protein
MRCAKCGSDNRDGRKFCSKCGVALARQCPRCGASNEPGEDFCGECGSALAANAVAAATGPPQAASTAPNIRVTPEQERLALRAARALGAPVAGVDLLPGPDGSWYVVEVNAVPGWRSLAPVTGIDVAAEMLRFLANDE